MGREVPKLRVGSSRVMGEGFHKGVHHRSQLVFVQEGMQDVDVDQIARQQCLESVPIEVEISVRRQAALIGTRALSRVRSLEGEARWHGRRASRRGQQALTARRLRGGSASRSAGERMQQRPILCTGDIVAMDLHLSRIQYEANARPEEDQMMSWGAVLPHSGNVIFAFAEEQLVRGAMRTIHPLHRLGDAVELVAEGGHNLEQLVVPATTRSVHREQ